MTAIPTSTYPSRSAGEAGLESPRKERAFMSKRLLRRSKNEDRCICLVVGRSFRIALRTQHGRRRRRSCERWLSLWPLRRENPVRT